MSTTDPTTTKPTTTSAPRTEGSKLAGCYVLSRRLDVGEGREVWLANDEVLGKDVSLHFIPDAVRKDGRALQELRADIKRNRQLIHPNILRVYDLVEEPEWVAISMEAFEGESLAQRLGRQSGQGNKVAEVQGWAEQLAQTLEEAHKINVLHLDLAPSNLFLTSAGKLFVANFGISRTLRDAAIRTGGKESPELAYQSPQRLEGKPPARTDDIYSLGAVLYAAVTGRAPFVGNDLSQQVRAGIAAETLAALRKSELGLPENWVKTITACLDKHPEARPASAGDVIRALKDTSSKEAAAPAAAAAAPVPTPAESPKPAKTEKPGEAGKAQKGEHAASSAKPAAELAATAKTSEALPKESAKEPAKSAASTSPVPPAKAPERPPVSDFKPRLYPEQSGFPWIGLIAAAAVIVVLAIVYQLATSGKRTAASNSAVEQPEKAELRAIPQATPAAETAPPADAPVVQTNEPQPATPAPALEGPAKVMAEKVANLEKAKQAMQAAEKSYADLQQQQQAADAELAVVQASIDEKTKAAELAKKSAEEAAAQRTKMEEQKKAAELAAAEAQKQALEKTRLAEEAAAALAELEKANAERMAAPQKAEAEMAALQTTLAEKQRIATENAKAVAHAETMKKQQLAAVTESEGEIERLKSADLEAQRRREAAEAQKSKLDQELAEMQRLFKEKMADLEAKRKLLENPAAAPADPQPAPSATPAPAAPSKSAPPATPSVVTPSAAAPAPAASEPMQVAKLSATPAPAAKGAPPAVPVAGGNSLGLKFVKVGDVEFSIWLTRVKDFEIFAKAVNLKSNSWKGPGFKQGPDHPVVNVSWQEAVAFCKWLTDQEQKDGTLPKNQFYRLPTDLEWSKAVGLPEEGGKTPEVRDMGIPDEYPWGKAWPPPAGAGNYTGEETGSDVAIRGYDDGFAWTAPVGSFPPNKLGLYDMGGNVWQWCMDAWNETSKAKVLRGASWYNGALKLSLLSSCRVHAAPDSSTDNYGFRIVRASEAPKPTKK